VICVLPFHKGDADLCINLLNWIYELGAAKEFKCILITDPKSPKANDDWPDERLATIQKLAKKNFKSVQQIWTPYRRRMLDGTSNWPMGANWAFYCASLHVAMSVHCPFLWLEPDMVPLKEGWLDELMQAYLACGKPIMGPVLQTNMPEANPTYVNGTSIYAPDSIRYFDRAMIDFLNGGGNAFDVAAAAMVVPNTAPTRLIQHFWGSDRTTAPTFKDDKLPSDPWNVFTLGHLFPEAVLYHRVKDDSLISLLREKRQQGSLVTA